MKKAIFQFLCVFVLLVCVVCVSAEDVPAPGTSSLLTAGVYKTGMDFPAGSYRIECGNPGDGCCYTIGSNYLKKLGNEGSYLSNGMYEICSYDSDNPTIRIYFEKGDILFTSDRLLFTAAGPVEILADAETTLERGIYKVGKDLPEGSFEVTCPVGDYGCRFYLSADSLTRLSNPYEEAVRQSIDAYLDSGETYHVFFEEDGAFYTDSAINLLPSGPLNFR